MTTGKTVSNEGKTKDLKVYLPPYGQAFLTLGTGVLGEKPGAMRAGCMAAGILTLLSETSPHPDQNQETRVLFLSCHQTAGRLREQALIF